MSITKDVAVRLRLNGADDVKASLTSVTEQADRLGTKTAVLSIDANQEDWEIEAAKVLEQAKELGATKVRIAVAADSEHAGMALDSIKAKADELGLKKVTIKVNVDDAEALAKLAALKTAGDGGFMDSLMGKNSGSESQGILGNLGSVLSLSGESSGGLLGGIGSIAAVGAIAQGLGTAAVAGLGLAAALAPIAGKIMPEISSAWGKWSNQIAGTKDAKAAISAAGNAFGDLLKAVTPLTMVMLPDLTRLFKNIGQSAESGGIKTFFTWMSVNAPKAFDAVSKAVRLGGAAIHDLEPVIHLIGSDFSAFFHVIDAGFDLIGGVIDLFTGHWHAAGGEFGKVASNMWAAVKSMVGGVLSLFGSLPGRIIHALGDLGSLLWNAGKSLISGLITGIKNAIPGLSGVLGWVTNMIPSWKGPPATDALLLRGNGRLIMGGLVSGITDGMPGLHSQLAGITREIGSTPVRAGSNMLGGSNGGAVQVVVSFDRNGVDDAMITALKKCIRIRGGNPAILGR